jgi:uncharacterized membrane protein YkvA (DUF1232 family)
MLPAGMRRRQRPDTRRCAMRTFEATPNEEPLPWMNGHVEPGRTAPTAPVLATEAVERFDALLHELNPAAPRIDGDRLRGLCGWLASLPAEHAREVLDRRLRRIEVLRAMLDDPAWDPEPGLCARLRKLFGYIDQDDDLIPDHEPVLGTLDDVVLIEFAWPAFVDEADEYRDFCAYRDESHPVGDGAAQRGAWIRDRLAEIALWRHHARVNASRYAQGRPPDDYFHVV